MALCAAQSVSRQHHAELGGERTRARAPQRVLGLHRVRAAVRLDRPLLRDAWRHAARPSVADTLSSRHDGAAQRYYVDSSVRAFHLNAHRFSRALLPCCLK
eukprot:5409446-Pleurochrysis_carterae.AAC.1